MSLILFEFSLRVLVEGQHFGSVQMGNGGAGRTVLFDIIKLLLLEQHLESAHRAVEFEIAFRPTELPNLLLHAAAADLYEEDTFLTALIGGQYFGSALICCCFTYCEQQF